MAARIQNTGEDWARGHIWWEGLRWRQVFPFREIPPIEPVIFAEKLRRPDTAGLSRSRLEDRLFGPSAPTVSCVLGPAGSGKTTLLAQIATKGPALSAWYSASGEHGSEASLVGHLALALGTALSDEEIVQGSRTGRIETLVTALERAQPRPLQLVVDDVHEVAGSSAERALARFIDLRPRSIRIAVGSRHPPPSFNIPRLMVSGELGQVDADDLRFRTWEVEDLFRSVYRRPLSPEAAAALTRRVGGWAAGLHLFHLATRELTGAELDRAVGELKVRSQMIRSYVTKNVLDGLDDVRRSFLLRTSTLGVLSGRMCDALLGRSGSAALLQDLERQQFFITTADGGVTYRYHRVLQAHLEELLTDDLEAADARALYALSAAILEEAGHVSEALRAHARAENWVSVQRLLQQSSSSFSGAERAWLIGGRRLASDDPWIALTDARRMFRSGRIADAASAFRRAESLLEDGDLRTRCAVERAVVEDWLPSAPRDPAMSSDSPLQVSRGLRRATRSALSVSDESGLVGGVTRLLSGDTVGAATELRRALNVPGLPVWEVLAIRLTAQLAELSQSDDTCISQLDELVVTADLNELPWLSRVARGLQYVVLGVSSPAEPSWLDSGRKLIEECEREDDGWGSCVLALAVGAACLATDVPFGNEMLNIADATAEQLDAPVLQAWAAILRASSAARRNERDAARLVHEANVRAADLGVAVDSLFPAFAASLDDDGRAKAPSRGPDRPQLMCLGSFELLADGQEVPWRTLRPRAQSLLMLLAMRHKQQVHRETLVDVLWPDAQLDAGIRSLQVAVSSVRRCLLAAGLAEGCLQRRGDSYALCLPEADVQLDQFERLARRAVESASAGDLSASLVIHMEVLERYTGDLLPEVGPADWVVRERDRLRGVAAGAGAEAARLALALGELGVGVRAARRSIELDPYRDRTWDSLVEGLERMGDHSAAAIARREHSRASAELGI